MKKIIFLGLCLIMLFSVMPITHAASSTTPSSDLELLQSEFPSRKVIELPYNRVSSFGRGLVNIWLNDKQGVIDLTGKEIIKPKYDHVKDGNEGLFAVKLGDKWGLINKKGKEIVNPIYDDNDIKV